MKRYGITKKAQLGVVGDCSESKEQKRVDRKRARRDNKKSIGLDGLLGETDVC